MQPIKHSIASLLAPIAPTVPQADNQAASSQPALSNFSVASLLAPTVSQTNHQAVSGQPAIKGYSISALLAPTVPHAYNQSVNGQPAVKDISETNQESDWQCYERMRNNCLALLAERNFDLSGINWPPGLTQQIFLSQLKTGPRRQEVMEKQNSETETQNTRVQKHKCVHCGKEFRVEKQFRRHLRKHTDIRPFLCDICPSTFKSIYHLTQHQESHTARKHQCVACNLRFETSSELENHMNAYKDLHGTKNPITKMFDCKRCGRSLTKLGHLKRHMQYSNECREELKNTATQDMGVLE